MRITLDIPEKDLRDILRYSGEDEAGAALAKLLTSQLMLQRRRELCGKPMIEKLHAVPSSRARSVGEEKGRWQPGVPTVSPVL